MPELKPCPFCGGVEISWNCNPAWKKEWFRCDICGVSGPTMENEYDAIAAWNKRVKLENLYRLGEALMVPITEEDGTEVIQRCKQCKEAEKWERKQNI